MISALGAGVSQQDAPPFEGCSGTRSRTLDPMTFRLHDAATRAVRQFQPARPGRASLYVRGTTVQGMPHMGHLRLAVCVDIAIRWLEASGYRVTYCRNLTDLDEAILAATAAEGTPSWVLAERTRRSYAQACAALACRPPDVDPYVADQVPEMIASFGPVFDIHAVGPDLICPEQGHYWLQVGQVRPARSMTEAVGRARPSEVRYFLAQEHYRATIEYSGAFLEEAAAAYQRIERFVTRARRMLHPPGGRTEYPPVDPRQRGGDPPFTPLPGGTGTNRRTEYPPGVPPYSVGEAPVSPPPTGLEAARPAVQGNVPLSFAAAMDDDLGVPAALMAVHATVHDGNYAISLGDRDAVAASLAQVRTMLAVLGLDPLDPSWATSDSSDRLHGIVDRLVGLALRQQEAALARGDYASADSIRDTLEAMGVEVEDTPAGPRWELKR